MKYYLRTVCSCTHGCCLHCCNLCNTKRACLEFLPVSKVIKFNCEGRQTSNLDSKTSKTIPLCCLKQKLDFGQASSNEIYQ